MNTGFTLVELIAVLTIITIMAVLSTPALNSVFRGSQLNQAGDMVQDQLNYFRQLALSNNYIVEVRFYSYKDPAISGDPGYYRAMQAFKVVPYTSAAGAILYTKTPITRAVRVPASIIIDSGSGASRTTSISVLMLYLVAGVANVAPIVNQGTQPSGAQSAATGDPTLFNVGTSYTYAAFQMNPDGSTNLPLIYNQNYNYFMTLHQLSSGDGLTKTTLPKNYYTIQIDPANGHLYTYRP